MCTGRTSSRGPGGSRTLTAPRSSRSPPSSRRLLLLEEPGHDELVTRFQQTTGAVMAKGVEDTAFYRYLRLTALNEVGGNPGRFSLSVDDFHRANLERAERFPNHLLATQTHDTKRSGDVRARIAVLAALADEWAKHRETLADARGSERGRTPLADARRGVADRGRASRRVHAEGAPRGEGEHELDAAERGARTTCGGRGAARGHRSASRLRGLRRTGCGPRPAQRARDDAAQAHGAGRRRRVPGRRARVAQPRRSGQPSSGRLRCPSTRAGATASTVQAPRDSRSARPARAASSSASTVRSTSAATCARSRAATTLPWSSRCAVRTRPSRDCAASGGACSTPRYRFACSSACSSRSFARGSCTVIRIAPSNGRTTSPCRSSRS